MISFKNKNNHDILVENEPLLYNFWCNTYKPKEMPNVKSYQSEKFINWLLDEKQRQKLTLIN